VKILRYPVTVTGSEHRAGVLGPQAGRSTDSVTQGTFPSKAPYGTATGRKAGKADGKGNPQARKLWYVKTFFRSILIFRASRIEP
jgi:hypothetical protein